MAIKVLFVCLGNICRSPTAHGVFQKLLNDAGLHDEIQVDSAGTGDWHIGRSPDQRSQAAALSRQYDLSSLRARQVCKADFETFDYILAMDECNLADLQAMHTHQAKCELALFLTYAKHTARREVPDPYYGGEQGFDEVLDLVEDAAEGLLHHICAHHGLGNGAAL
ncbi:protein-tyrosine-phosphatase [gamma proteobacterium BDW918]|jgi:protein-tyrosine phosphatase|uniref:protein-tyrosine-phosphatase n=1 Tax=Zhongshania aliphaticivorans TaxID=1470434 RepID=A0A127M4S9_9GAMM|nr:low molecular weight protein-tyrosine-phosphatase [Zhongshania aliphaticivorans]AMO68243.1 phosphotyrosine protein phosphatase [Zhongshania aliphaticivorans]EIF44357.1 protein-tyrosine-phosphatase [gamma proteobacterium BDW918]